MAGVWNGVKLPRVRKRCGRNRACFAFLPFTRDRPRSIRSGESASLMDRFTCALWSLIHEGFAVLRSSTPEGHGFVWCHTRAIRAIVETGSAGRLQKKKGNNPLFMINDRLGEADKVGVNVRIFSIIICAHFLTVSILFRCDSLYTVGFY